MDGDNKQICGTCKYHIREEIAALLARESEEMTRKEAIRCLSVHSSTNGSGLCTDKQHYEAKQMAIKALEQEPCEDAISRQAAVNIASGFCHPANIADELAKLPSVKPQEPKADKYEHHIDHTDCIWYGSDGGCPVTCSQYRDGWNDAMDYIFKNGKGYQPYRRDG